MEIEGYPNYIIYEDGRIWTKERKRVKGGFISPFRSRGYLLVTLACDGVQTKYQVHRLVAKTYIPNPNNYQVVHHIDGIRDNNHVSNLAWCSQMYNTQWLNTTRKFGWIGQDKGRTSYRVTIKLNKQILRRTFPKLIDARCFTENIRRKLLIFSSWKNYVANTNE